MNIVRPCVSVTLVFVRGGRRCVWGALQAQRLIRTHSACSKKRSAPCLQSRMSTVYEGPGDRALVCVDTDILIDYLRGVSAAKIFRLVCPPWA